MKTELFEFNNGEKMELKIKPLSFVKRNDLFGEFINLNDFNKSTDDSNPLSFIKSDKNPLKFIEEILRKGIEGVTIDDLEPGEGDALFEKYGNYIIEGSGGVTKN